MFRAHFYRVSIHKNAISIRNQITDLRNPPIHTYMAVFNLTVCFPAGTYSGITYEFVKSNTHDNMLDLILGNV